jgi:hypothetical protein
MRRISLDTAFRNTSQDLDQAAGSGELCVAMMHGRKQSRAAPSDDRSIRIRVERMVVNFDFGQEVIAVVNFEIPQVKIFVNGKLTGQGVTVVAIGRGACVAARTPHHGLRNI